MSQPMIIMLTSSEWSEVNRLLAAGAHNKIPAIKVVRAASRHSTSGTAADGSPILIPNVGLREAKEAVEALMAERGMTLTDGTPFLGPSNPVARISPFQPIVRVVCNFGTGDVELDMDGMSLRVLTGLNGSMRISDAVALIDLYKRIKSWEDEIVSPCKPAAGVV